MRSIPSPPIVTRRESTRYHEASNGMSTGQLRDCCLRRSYDFPQSPEHCSPTEYARVSRRSHGNVVMLFCSPFTQPERFCQTDQLIIRLQVAVVTNFIHTPSRSAFINIFQVKCSDLVGTDLPHKVTIFRIDRFLGRGGGRGGRGRSTWGRLGEEQGPRATKGG